MAFLIMFVCLFVCVSARPLGNDPDRYLAISCRDDLIWATPSDICRDYLDPSSTPTQNPGSLPTISTTQFPTLPILVVRSAQMADWLKAFLGICSGLLTLYSSAVSYFGFIQKLGLRRSLTFGLCGSRSEVLDAVSLPIQISDTVQSDTAL